VPQDDYLISTQTVQEALTFSARMRLPPSTSEDRIREEVQSIMRELHISHIAKSKIGNRCALSMLPAR